MCARWQFPLHLAPDLRHSVDHRPALGEGAVQIPHANTIQAVVQGQPDLGLDGPGVLEPDLVLRAPVVHVAEPGGLGLFVVPDGGAAVPGQPDGLYIVQRPGPAPLAVGQGPVIAVVGDPEEKLAGYFPRKPRVLL